jgi:hypothetical protein
VKREREAGLSPEERRRQFYEWLDAWQISPAKPRVAVVTVPVTAAVADAVMADPDAVRIVLFRPNGGSKFERPQGNALGLGVTVGWAEGVGPDGLPVLAGAWA